MANLEEIRYAQMIAGENAVIARLKTIGLIHNDSSQKETDFPLSNEEEEEIEQDVCDYCGVIQCVGSCQDF